MTDLKYRSLVNRVIECFEWAEPATEGNELFPYGSVARRDLEVGIDEILSGSFDKEVQETADKIAHATFEAHLLARKESDEAEKRDFQRNVINMAVETFRPPSPLLRTVRDFVLYGHSCLQRFAELEDEGGDLMGDSEEEISPSGAESEE